MTKYSNILEYSHFHLKLNPRIRIPKSRPIPTTELSGFGQKCRFGHMR